MIKTFVLMLLICLSLGADNYPRLFSEMGTPLYEADCAFEKLGKMPKLQTKIALYHENSKKTLASGRAIEAAEAPELKAIEFYFTALRMLQKEHDALITALQRALRRAMEKDDYVRFMQITDVGLDALFELPEIRRAALAYYGTHKAKGESRYLEKMEKSFGKLQRDQKNIAVASPTAGIKQKPLTILTASWCRACKRAKASLHEKGIVFTEYDIERSSTGRRLYKECDGHAVPIIIIGNECRTGYSFAWVEKRLK